MHSSELGIFWCLCSIEKAMGKLGGRAVYQAASNLSVSHFNTSKW